MSTKLLSRQLLHQIAFLENTSSSVVDQDNWEMKFLTYAEIIPLYDNSFSQLENISFGHVITEAYFIFKMRFEQGITIRLRIKFRDRIFEIKRIVNVGEQDRMLKIVTLEI